MRSAFIILAKYPVPGFVKTRLARSIGDIPASKLYHCFVSNILKNCSQPSLADELRIAVAQKEYLQQFELEFPGADRYISQLDVAELGEKMRYAIKQALIDGFKKVVVIGTDSPNLPVELIKDAFDLLEHNDVVIGPADDGGYYLIATKSDLQDLFSGISWGTERVLEQTLAAITKNKQSYRLLPEFYDIDDLESLYRLAKENPEIILECKAFAEETGMVLNCLKNREFPGTKQHE